MGLPHVFHILYHDHLLMMEYHSHFHCQCHQRHFMIHQELLDSAVRGAPAEEQRKKLAERVTWPSCGAGSGGSHEIPLGNQRWQ